ncbi:MULTISPECIES: PLP-dependent aminotransferase family protein [unclassified Streptomyces]|uniref:aminotransferase-like domain-containing protein n=1 Tax=unclassified Streptomyces TaxID=2593676 RepID=UPI001902DD2F|nr:PLP-dependent aminotransferase family protein [Streptomyces sp. HSG2]
MWTEARPSVEMPRLFERGGDLIPFAGGLPDLDVLPVDAISGRLSRLVRLGGKVALQYSTPHVARALVPAIVDLMAREGAGAEADDLIPTSGSQMGLMAAGLALGTPGETVLVQAPVYPGASAAFRTAGLRPRAIPEDAGGLSPDGLRETILQLRRDGHTARLVYCNPTFQNPTGATLPLDRRRELLAVAEELDLLVIEDNPYGLLGFDGETTPALRGIAPERVVYLGTFSKVFAPGLRCGWIAAPTAWVSALRRTAEVMTLSPSALAQATIAAFHTGHGWTELIDRYRARYRERCALMSDALERELGSCEDWTWRRPRGGFYLWLRHRGGLDTARLLATAEERGVSFVPGTHFEVDGGPSDRLRLCFSHVPRERIATGVARLSSALREVAS